jgi:hypothetical protein
MAVITSPKKKTTKGEPPPADKPSDNLTKAASSENVPLNFKVSTEFHREFKTYAAQHDISMLELLQRCFDTYKESTK